MIYLLNGQEMKACDQRTIEYYQVPSMVLMERAALAVVDAIIESGYDLSCIGIVCGMGNNGGDGLAVARLLYQKHLSVRVFLVGDESRATEQTARQLAIVKQYGIPVYHIGDDVMTIERFCKEIQGCSLLIDGIFGVGLSREVSGVYKQVIEGMNASEAKKVAIDIPSGVNADDGQILGCAVKADMTVTFAFCKVGLVLYPGADYAGNVKVVEIGITEDSLKEETGYCYTHSTKEILEMLPKRCARSNKGTYGKVVLVVGSKGMAGAAYLAAMAAYRMGCGLVRIVTPEENREIMQTLVPEAVLTTYDSQNPQNNEKELLDALQWGDAIGIGSGLGISAASEYLLDLVRNNTKVPVVIDGDGLNVLAKNPDWLRRLGKILSDRVVLTPHLGEMSRLVQLPIKEIQEKLIQTAVEFSKEYKVCCVLKDARTIVASNHGETYINLTGNHGMATGGSGDVLVGMITALIAQGMPVSKAAIAGVHLHGCAGDVAAGRLGERGMAARDLVDAIAQVISKI